MTWQLLGGTFSFEQRVCRPLQRILAFNWLHRSVNTSDFDNGCVDLCLDSADSLKLRKTCAGVWQTRVFPLACSSRGAFRACGSVLKLRFDDVVLMVQVDIIATSFSREKTFSTSSRRWRQVGICPLLTSGLRFCTWERFSSRGGSPGMSPAPPLLSLGQRRSAAPPPLLRPIVTSGCKSSDRM